MSGHSFSKVFKSEDGSPEVDCEDTEEIVCPWCGYVFSDSWEFRWEENVITCEECKRELRYFRRVDVTYSTEKVVE